ncbi:MAG: SagB/ThcOx family dehydrogenase [Anaerolineales bacterium]|nr:SagB/ThcOx family dehydrogenase [Anaerolineales bacterium]
MNNQDTQAGWRYHDGTKHPYGALMNPHHRYNPGMPLLLLKKYVGLESVPLPQDKTPLGVPALDVLAGPAVGSDQTGTLDLSVLARLLHFSAGITKIIRRPWGDLPFRAAACTGALYHIELYVVCGDLPGLEAGVYHYDPEASSLDVLRSGDFRPFLVQASGGSPVVARAPATLVFSDVFWRNAVKYQAREYRHAYWDSGTILANTLAMASAHQLEAQLVLGFVDKKINHLLGLDGSKEAALALLPVGAGDAAPAGDLPHLATLPTETLPVSRYEIDFPPIREMHEASALEDGDQVASWRAASYLPKTIQDPANLVGLAQPDPGDLPQDSIEETIIRRGSTRKFALESISAGQLATILSLTTGPIPFDCLLPAGGSLTHPYLIVQAVDGLPSGAYFYHREQQGLELLKPGDFRAVAGHLGLGQALPAEASANIYFLADLKRTFEAYGNRGYRLAQLEASITAGKMYLAAYAQRLGATGLTFYDDEVTAFFSPHAEGLSVMFLIALGVPARKTIH